MSDVENDAQRALSRAIRANDELLAHDDNFWSEHTAQYREAWSDILIYGGRTFTKIEQLAKALKNPAWFNSYRSARKTDPLLLYLWHARNVDEHHGIAVTYSVEETSGFVHVQRGKPIDIKLHATDRGIFMESRNNNATVINQPSKRYILKSVFDRGVRFDPPTSHLGVSIVSTDPTSVAGLYVNYLKKMAEDFAKQTASNP